MSEIDLKGATIKGSFVVPEGVTTVKNGNFELFDGMSLEKGAGTSADERVETAKPEMVTLTYFVPEQEYSQDFPRAEYDKAVADGSLGDMLDYWISDTDTYGEVLGPDGQKVPLW